VWVELGRQSGRAIHELIRRKIHTKDILTDKAVENAMAVHAAFGGSTNLLLHLPAIAHAAGLKMPTVADWTAVNRRGVCV
jgi:dihydroxyacid dehydratase/phosphogluconate dehydratase